MESGFVYKLLIHKDLTIKLLNDSGEIVQPSVVSLGIVYFETFVKFCCC